MKSEFEIRHELLKVRKRLKDARDCGEENDMLYGAQQALGWVIYELRSPSELEDMILETAARI